jgi:hypothetical protein
MKINLIIFTFLACALASQAATTVAVKVVGKDGAPISEAEVKVASANAKIALDGTITPADESVGYSDEDGLFAGTGYGPMGISIWVKKEGYYPHGYPPAKTYRITDKTNEATLHETVVLRSIEKPIPLHAQQSEIWSASQREIPLMDAWVGFDFEEGDWVKPHGDGKSSDVLFRYNGEFVKFVDAGWPMEKLREVNRRKVERQGRVWNEEVFRKEAGLWKGTLEISFPSEKEGLVKVEESFMPHSVLRMPHQAPEDGYAPTHVYQEADSEPHTFRDDVGYFLRTRVVLDRQGNIESANYAKIYGDFQFSPKGYVAFDYYFNPTPNDRNLEFDPKRNLLPDNVEGSNVILP